MVTYKTRMEIVKESAKFAGAAALGLTLYGCAGIPPRPPCYSPITGNPEDCYYQDMREAREDAMHDVRNALSEMREQGLLK